MSNDNYSSFKIRSYSVCELAMEYFPHLSKNSASNSFRRMINKNSELIKNLEAKQYKKYAKRLTPKMVGIIIEYLGEPY